jgi:hypothetical protein
MRAALQHSGPDLIRSRMGDRFLLMLALVLLGYALGGRGFAYVGYPPIFIGEITLAFGVFAFLLTRGWTSVMRMSITVTALPLVIWGSIRLLPGLAEYQLIAARDAVVWGYSLFALIVAGLIVSDPTRLPRLIEYYRRFSKIFLIGIPIVFMIYRYGKDVLPRWPWASYIIQEKEGDVLVHLSGILALWMADPKGNVRWIWAGLLTLNMAMMGVIDRAGVISFGAVMIVCMIARPRHAAAWRTISMILVGILLLWASSIRIEVPGGKGRDISWEQFVLNFKSVFGESEDHGLDSNKEWRVRWWADIVDYTVHGPYFWTGKGFGINLATDDGYQVMRDESLRSPHNVHMTILARMGVPGIVAWTLMHTAWMYCVADAYLKARRRGQGNWCGLFLFLFSYCIAFVINGSFDVFIEGPMGGIWFWTIYGASVGALWTYRYHPEVLADSVIVDEDSRRTQLLPAAGWGRPGLPLGAGASRIARA